MVLNSYTASLAAALAPLLAITSAFIIPLLSGFIRRSVLFAFLFSELVFILNTVLTGIVYIYVYFSNNIIVYMFAGFPPPLGIIYEIDHLSAFIGLIVSIVFSITNIVSYHYLESISKHNEWFYTLYLGLEAGLLGIVYTGDLFNLFVMLEVMSISAYGLTAYLREQGKPLNAAIKYGLIGAVGSTMYFIAVVLLYSGLGTLSMPDVAADSMGINNMFFSETQGLASNPLPVLTLFTALAVWAFLIETAIVPHHFWLPDAYTSMPSTVAATMAAIAEGVGLYVLARIIYTVVGYSTVEWVLWVLLVLGSLNIVVGGYLTATANDLKRLIAYSTILDIGYAVIGLGLASSIGVAAALYYVLGHAFVKPLLFLAAGVIELSTGSTSLDVIQGVMKKNPLAGLSLLIGGLAVIGVPPLNLFFAKLMLFQAVFEKGYYPLLAILLLGSVFALVGFSRLWYCTCTRRRLDTMKGVKEYSAPIEVKTVLTIFIILVIATGVLYSHIMESIINPITNDLVLNSTAYRREYISHAYELFKLVKGG